MSITFIQVPLSLIDYIQECQLTSSEYKLWLYLFKLDPFGDRFISLPSPTEIAVQLKLSVRTITRAAQRLQDLALFDFQIHSWCAKNATSNRVNKGKKQRSRSSPQVLEARQNCRQTDKNVPTMTEMSVTRQGCPNLVPELLPDKASSSQQTDKTTKTLQTEERENQIETNKNQSVYFPSAKDIPQDLKQKLEELNIRLDNFVISQINKFDISQAYGAVAHVENTIETINNPRSVFLYQLPKQPVEKLGSLHRVLTPPEIARTTGITVDYLQRTYGASWKEAAVHFGLINL